MDASTIRAAEMLGLYARLGRRSFTHDEFIDLLLKVGCERPLTTFRKFNAAGIAGVKSLVETKPNGERVIKIGSANEITVHIGPLYRFIAELSGKSPSDDELTNDEQEVLRMLDRKRYRSRDWLVSNSLFGTKTIGEILKRLKAAELIEQKRKYGSRLTPLGAARLESD